MVGFRFRENARESGVVYTDDHKSYRLTCRGLTQ